MELQKYLLNLENNTRVHAPYFCSGEKVRGVDKENELHNLGEACDSVEELRNLIGPPGSIKHLHLRGQGKSYEKEDPPDIEIVKNDDTRIGIEVTELVNQDSCEAAERSEEYSPIVGRSKFLEILNRRIFEKDISWGEDFDHKVLLILCDELSLNKRNCEDYLAGEGIEFKHINLALIFFSPEPGKEESEALVLTN